MNIFDIAIKETYRSHSVSDTGLVYSEFNLKDLLAFEAEECMYGVRVVVTNRGGMILQYTAHDGAAVTKACRVSLDNIDRKALRYRLKNVIRIWDIYPENRIYIFYKLADALRLRIDW